MKLSRWLLILSLFFLSLGYARADFHVLDPHAAKRHGPTDIVLINKDVARPGDYLEAPIQSLIGSWTAVDDDEDGWSDWHGVMIVPTSKQACQYIDVCDSLAGAACHNAWGVGNYYYFTHITTQGNGDATCSTYCENGMPLSLWCEDESDNPIPPAPFCGDGICRAPETCISCSPDCGQCALAHCGDGSCNTWETAVSCPADCHSNAVCGNFKCEPGEHCGNCPSDCDDGPGCFPN